MNWNRGLRRITLILSIIGAILGAVISYKIYSEDITEAKNDLYWFKSRYESGVYERMSIDDYNRSILHHEKMIKYAKDGTIGATIAGFFLVGCAVWVSYLVTKLIIYAVVLKKIAYPMLIWVKKGFAEDKKNAS